MLIQALITLVSGPRSLSSWDCKCHVNHPVRNEPTRTTGYSWRLPLPPTRSRPGRVTCPRASPSLGRCGPSLIINALPSTSQYASPQPEGADFLLGSSIGLPLLSPSSHSCGLSKLPMVCGAEEEEVVLLPTKRLVPCWVAVAPLKKILTSVS